MDKIPTAEELKKLINAKIGYADQEIYDAITEFNNSRIEFAKLHVEAALKAITDNSFEVKSEATNKMLELVTKESILTAYPLNNIK